MKQSIKLETLELASLFSRAGFTLYLRDGQDITLFADRADLGANGSTVSSQSNGKKTYPEPTCERCGCTQGAACPGGCEWIRLDEATNAGLCSTCAGPMGEETPAEKPRRRPGKKRRQGRTKSQKFKGRHATSEERKEAKETFLRVLKESSDIKKAYQAAGVSDVTGYKWRKEAGLDGNGLRRKPRRKFNPRSRDFNQARNLPFWCRPCGKGYPTKEALNHHQEKAHGVKIMSSPEASVVS